MNAPMMHLWDSALMQVLPKYYSDDASPQTLYRIKHDMIQVMRDQHHIDISASDERRIRVQWNGEDQSVNIIVPPNLLAGHALH